MARALLLLAGGILTTAVVVSPAFGQASVEYGTAAGAAATGTAGTAKPIGGIMKSLGKALDSAGGNTGAKSSNAPAGTTAARPATSASKSTKGGKKATAKAEAAPATPPPPPPSYEDPATIPKGIGYEELVKRFGPPALEMNDGVTRSFTYLGKAGSIHVQFEDGKVKSVEKPKS